MLDIVQQAVREEADGRSTGSREEGSGEEVKLSKSPHSRYIHITHTLSANAGEAWLPFGCWLLKHDRGARGG